MSTDKRKFKPAREVLEKIIGPLTFAMFMRVAREQLELTQTEMAKKLGMGRSAICDIEKGRTFVSVTFAIKVAKKSGLSERVAVLACLQDQLRRAKLDWKIEIKAS